MKFSHVLEQSPRDWETTMHQNVVLAFFHTQNICHRAWKILRTTLCCFGFSPIPGKRFEKQVKLCPIVFLAFQTFSSGLEKNKARKCGSENFPRTVTYILCVEKCQNHILIHSCLPIPGRPFPNVTKLHGLRISE